MITMQMQKIKKPVPIPKKQQIKKKDENKDILLKYMGDVDDKLLKNTVTVKILTVL